MNDDCICIKGTSKELINMIYNETQGPAARLAAFKQGVRATLDALGVKYEFLPIVDVLKI